MEMKDVKKVTIVAGPNKIAYYFYPANGELVVWVGDAVQEEAPKRAIRTEIKPGFSEWSWRVEYDR